LRGGGHLLFYLLSAVVQTYTIILGPHGFSTITILVEEEEEVHVRVSIREGVYHHQ